jgi:hypothetical protein
MIEFSRAAELAIAAWFIASAAAYAWLWRNHITKRDE